MSRQNITIQHAKRNDLEQILALQLLAYESEARLLNDWSIQPLHETIEEVTQQFDSGVFLKAIDATGEIIGSVRGQVENDILHIGKLIVHPRYQGKGIGKRLLQEIEDRHPFCRCQLFTSDKSARNLALYEKSGYVRFAEKPLGVGSNLIFLEKTASLRLYPIAERSGRRIDRLLAVWEGSVQATHHFLSENDIRKLKPLVRRGLMEIPHLVVAPGNDKPSIAFMGIDGDRIEMLFISPGERGKGLGRKLLMCALREFGADKVDVNEQNCQGKGFYQHLGFEIVGRSAVDAQGNPFPLLHMKYRRIV